MYLVYINEFPSVVQEEECRDSQHNDTQSLFNNNCENCCLLPVFADDGQYQHCSRSRTTNQDKIDCNFINIKDYLNSQGLQINYSKTNLTEYMSCQKRARLKGIPPNLTVKEKVGDKRRPGSFKLEDKLINDSNYCRTLVMNLRNNLNWEAHLLNDKRAVLPAARKQLQMLFRMKDKLSQKVRLQLTNSLVISKITYGICLWGNTTPNYIRKAEILLNSAGRFVTRNIWTTRQTTLMSLCGWLDITELTAYHSLLQMFRTVRWGVPKYLKDKITINEEDKISTKAPRLQLTASSYRIKTVENWNKLPK